MADTQFLRHVDLMHSHVCEVRTTHAVLMGTSLNTGQASGSVAGEPVGLEAGPSQMWVIGSQSANRTDLLASTIPTPQAFH